MLPKSREIAAEQPLLAVTAIVLAPPGLMAVIERRLAGLRPNVAEIRFVHDPLTAMSELGVLMRGNGEMESREIVLSSLVILVVAQPDSITLQREIFDAVERYFPSVPAIPFDEPGLHLLEVNASLFAAHSTADQAAEATAGESAATSSESEEWTFEDASDDDNQRETDSDLPEPEPMSITREEMDMLLQESVPGGGGWHDGGTR